MNAGFEFADHAPIDGPSAAAALQGTKESADRAASASPTFAAVDSAALVRQSRPGWHQAPADEPEPVAAEQLSSIVRPYAWTAGRTASTRQFAIETLVSTTEYGRWQPPSAGVEHQMIADLCREPRSVAEVAALLSFPLGVAKVLLSDMAELGLVTVHDSAADDDAANGLMLMERVLSGLHRL